MTQKTINEPHCQQCGRTDYESLETGDQGYTACCNEIVIYPMDQQGAYNFYTGKYATVAYRCDPRDCYHN